MPRPSCPAFAIVAIRFPPPQQPGSRTSNSLSCSQDEIGRKPEGEGSMEREGYSLGAGLALGLVTLGTAGRAWGLWDLRMEDRLQRYFSPALDPSLPPRPRFHALFFHSPSPPPRPLLSRPLLSCPRGSSRGSRE
ncbi:unnamed protein product [Closterium sp. NIES-64]|nr:unnamed protein product [Closterium sp. NIES-64]